MSNTTRDIASDPTSDRVRDAGSDPTSIQLSLSKEEYSLALALMTLGGEAFDGREQGIEPMELLDRAPPRVMRSLWRKLETINEALEKANGC